MTLSYPLSLAAFADQLPIEAAPFAPLEQREATGLGTGEILTAELGPRLIETTVILKPVKHTVARKLRALIDAAMDGAFYFYDPTDCYPTNDPGGLILTGHAVTVKSVNADNIRIALQGLTAGFVLAYDLVAIDYGSPTRRALLRMVGTVTADGSGDTAQFEVRPYLRPGIQAGDAVTLLKPAIKARIVPGSVSPDMGSTTTERISFRIRQTLQAG